MNKPRPLVSVYLPTRNRSALLSRCIASILSQTYRNLELLIVDDASTDDTREILQAYSRADARVRLYHHERAVGAPAARNLAIRHAQGEFLTGMDDDDVMLPNRLETLMTAFDPQYSLVCSGFLRKTRTRVLRLADSRMVIDLDDQLMRNHVGNAALSLTTRFREIGLFDESMPAWQDYDLWTRMIRNFGPALRIDEVSHVVHEDHDLPRISEKAMAGAARFLEKHRALMSAEHLTSQALETFMLGGQRMSPFEMLRLSTARTRWRALRYLITSNFPVIRRLRG
jgi:glycosyltransferase involved in cell wall biosynthesis